MSVRTSIVESIRWLTIAQILSQIIRVGVSIYVIRQLQTEQMAYVALANTIGGFLEMFATLGLGVVVISRNDISEKDLSNIAGMIILINAILFMLLIGASGAVAGFFDIQELANILRVMALGFIASAFSSVPSALLTKEMRFKELSIIQLCASLIGALTSLTLVNFGFEYWSIVIGGLAFIVAKAVLIIMASGRIVVPSFAVKESANFISFGGFVMLSGMVWYIYTTIDVVIAGRFWSPEVLGIYAVAVQLTVMPLNRLMPILRQVALPAFSRALAEDRTRLEEYIGKSLQMSISVCAPFFFGISCIATPLVLLLLGPNWSGAALPLACLCIAAPFRVCLELMGPAIITTGNPGYQFRNTSVIAAVMIASFTLAVSISSEPVFLALVWMLIYPTAAIIACRSYCSVMAIQFRSVFNSIAKPLMHSSIMWLVVTVFIRIATPHFELWFVLIAAISLGMLLYIGLVMLFDRELIAEYRLMIAARKGA